MTAAPEPLRLPKPVERVERLAYSAADAAEALNVDRKTIYAWINRGWLRAFHAGRVMRISRAALLEFIAAREEEERWG